MPNSIIGPARQRLGLTRSDASGFHEDITIASRYECKYLVSPMQVSGIREFIGPFVQPDSFAARRPGYRYPICSLYLDSHDLSLYQQTVGGNKNRFKLRVRSYTDNPSVPVFLEVKLKTNNIVQKRRGRLERDRAVLLLRDPFDPAARTANDDDDVDFFATHTSLTSARPVIKVRYVREAYEARGGDPVRVTIDTDLMHTVALAEDFRHDRGRWVTTPIRGVILELKFTDRFPAWIHDLVQVFGLKQQPVPKYVWSVDHMLLHGRETPLALSGLTLPPRRGSA